MTEPRDVDPMSLTGEHVLTGCDPWTPPRGEYEYEDANGLRFVLDGIIYEAKEDPSDGYRSTLDYLRVVEGPPVANTFTPCRVVGTKRDNDYGQNDTVEFRDAVTGKVVLAIGTDNSDDYYPVARLDFTPEHMAVNAGPQP